MGWISESEDLTVFTDNEFSTVATVDSATSALTELSGLFDSNYEPMFDAYGQSTEAEGRNISFLVETALINDLHHSDRLNIKGKNYLITGIQPIDDGKLTSLVLKEDLK